MKTNNLFQKSLDMPWATINELRRLFALPYIRLYFSVAGIAWGRNWKIYGRPIIQRHSRSSIQLGDDLDLRSWPTTNPLTPVRPVVLSTRSSQAMISVGNHVGMTGVILVADQQIKIGNWVVIGANVTIMDTDFHPLHPEIRKMNPQNGIAAPIVIEDDVFIGMNSIVLKGVTIGRGSVIGAGSVVTRSIPPGVIAAGNPARVIKPLDS